MAFNWVIADLIIFGFDYFSDSADLEMAVVILYTPTFAACAE